MLERSTTRRALLKVTGALGTVAALAVPVTVLPKAEAAVADTSPIAALWPERQRLKAEAERLERAYEAAHNAYCDQRPERPKEALAPSAFLLFPASWETHSLPNGRIRLSGDSRCWKDVAEHHRGRLREEALRRASVMEAHERECAALKQACGIDAAWERYDAQALRLADHEDRILALPVTSLGDAGMQARILRDQLCIESDDVVMHAFFDRIEAAGREGAAA